MAVFTDQATDLQFPAVELANQGDIFKAEILGKGFWMGIAWSS